jgi:hypothetical protein
MKPEAKKEFSKLAREVMDIVLDVAARRLEQTLAEVHNIKEQEHQDFRLQNDREWREKLDHVKAESDQWREAHDRVDHRALALAQERDRLRGTLEYILAQAKQGYPTVLSVIKANAEAALDDERQKAYAEARALAKEAGQ